MVRLDFVEVVQAGPHVWLVIFRTWRLQHFGKLRTPLDFFGISDLATLAYRLQHFRNLTFISPQAHFITHRIEHLRMLIHCLYDTIHKCAQLGGVQLRCQ